MIHWNGYWYDNWVNKHYKTWQELSSSPIPAHINSCWQEPHYPCIHLYVCTICPFMHTYTFSYTSWQELSPAPSYTHNSFLMTGTVLVPYCESHTLIDICPLHIYIHLYMLPKLWLALSIHICIIYHSNTVYFQLVYLLYLFQSLMVSNALLLKPANH